MTVTVKIIRNQRQKPADKLADAELHFQAENQAYKKFDGLRCATTGAERKPHSTHSRSMQPSTAQ